MRRVLLAAMLLMLLAACTGSSLSPASIPGATGITATAGTASTGSGATIEPGTTPVPIAEPTPVPSIPPLDRPDLRYRLVDQLGRPLFCDPDYPIARADEALLARLHLAAIRADAPTHARPRTARSSSAPRAQKPRTSYPPRSGRVVATRRPHLPDTDGG